MPMFWRDRSTKKYSEEEVREKFKDLYDFTEDLDKAILGTLGELWFNWLKLKEERFKKRIHRR